MIKLSSFFENGYADSAAEAKTLSDMARGMVSSRILTIAYSVRDKIESGAQVANFTVGDFAPSQFQIPQPLKNAITDAIEADQTNYPPAHGTPELRHAILDHYRREIGLDFPDSSVVVASGARPVLYAGYRCLVDPGENVLTPAPSWNNNNFCHLVGANHLVVSTRPEDAFMPTVDSLMPYIQQARLLVLCSPMNPAGTMMSRAQMDDICQLVLAENARRDAAGERALYLIFDQVYRMLTFGDHRHITPIEVAPEMARYTLMTDAISKCFAATGLRVGWVVAPPVIAERVKALLTHMGAWAPRPEQIGTATFLRNTGQVNDYLVAFREKVRARLRLLYDAFSSWKSQGLPVDVIEPQGALYLSVYFGLEGRAGLPDEEAVRMYLLDKAGCALIPFSAFGDDSNVGWMRFSVGAVSTAEIEACIRRLKPALEDAISRA